MADWQVADASAFSSEALGGGAYPSVTITSGSANAYGSYVTIIDPTPFTASGIIVTINYGAIGAHYTDIAVGAAASEVTLISKMFSLSPGVSTPEPGIIFFPIAIPAGSRISARSQCATGSTVSRMGLTLVGSGFPSGSFNLCQTLGPVATTDRVKIANSQTAGTKSAWSELSAATATDIQAVGLCECSSVASGTNYIAYDLGIRAAGSEVILIPDISVIHLLNSPANWFGPLPCRIPVGSRVAFRSSSQASSASNVSSLLVYGFS
jgi:hypothetical protein